LTVEHIVRANSFSVTSVKALVGRTFGSSLTSGSSPKPHPLRRIAFRSVAGLKGAIMEYLDTRNTDPKSFISIEFVGKIRKKAACPEKSAIVTTLAGWQSP